MLRNTHVVCWKADFAVSMLKFYSFCALISRLAADSSYVLDGQSGVHALLYRSTNNQQNPSECVNEYNLDEG